MCVYCDCDGMSRRCRLLGGPRCTSCVQCMYCDCDGMSRRCRLLGGPRCTSCVQCMSVYCDCDCMSRRCRLLGGPRCTSCVQCMYVYCDCDGMSRRCRLLGGHGSLEGVGGLKTNEAYHSKADALLIPKMYFFLKFTYVLGFWKCLFYKIRPLFRFACATGYDTGGIRANGT